MWLIYPCKSCGAIMGIQNHKEGCEGNRVKWTDFLPSPPYSDKDITDLIDRTNKRTLMDALEFAAFHHKGQFRDDGEAYIFHPVRVAAYSELYIKGDRQIIRDSCLLHDVIEDCGVSKDEISKYFGVEVSNIVWDLTNYFTKKTHPHFNRRERKKREHKRLAACSILTQQIKLIDRLDNITYSKISQNSNYLEESRDLVENIGGAHAELAELLLKKMERYQ